MNCLLRILSVCMFFMASIAVAQPTINNIQTYNMGGAPPIAITNTPTNTKIYLTFGVPIFNATGGVVTNAYATSSVFTLVDDMSVTIPFTATISGNIITITPNHPSATNGELKSNTTYTLTFIASSLSDDATVTASTLNVANTFDFTTASSTNIALPTTASVPPTDLTICNNATYRVLGNIVMSEASSASFGEGTNQSFEMAAPLGFEFRAGIGSISISPVGADISNASVSVVANKITIFYTINSNYVSTDVITLSGIEVKIIATPPLPSPASANLMRTGGTATQAANRVDNTKPHATFNVATAPTTAPTLNAQSNLSGTVYGVCQGFVGQTIAINNTGAGAGSVVKVYDKVTNVLLFTSAPIATVIANISSDLGVLNTVLGTKTFYARRVNSATLGNCDGPTIDFSIIVQPNPFAIITGGSGSFCSGDTPIFSAFGTAGNTYTFSIKPSASAFVAASGYGTVTATTFTPSTSIAADSYILQAIATNTNGCSTTTTMPFVVNAVTTPIFTFTATSYPDDQITAVALTGGSPAGGIYSGPGVTGTSFFPNAAGIGTHAIVYSYTNASLCVGTATVFFTVFNASATITGLANSYCNNSPVTGILTPNAAIFGPPALTIELSPSTPFGAVFVTATTDREFFFPSFGGGINEGITWDGLNYRFNPSLVMISSGTSKVVPIRFVRYNNSVLIATPELVPYNVTVYALPALAVDFSDGTTFALSPTKVFCQSDASVVVSAVVNGAVAPVGAIYNFEYKLNSSATWLTLPSNTITPSALAVGIYNFRMSYTSPASFGGCVSPVLTRNFQILSNTIPTFSLANTDYCVSTVANPTVVVANANNGGTSRSFTVTQTSPIVGVPIIYTISNFAPAAISQTIPVVDLNGAGTYSIKFTSTNGSCVATSAIQTFTISTLPILTVDFTYVTAANGNTPANPNKFCVGNNTLTFAVSATNLGSETFVASRGFITIRNNPSSSPTTPAFSQNLAGGINSLYISYGNPFPEGEYFIDYTYTKLNGCVVKTTCSSLLIYSFYPAPDFDFPTYTAKFTSYTICESVTSLTLTPFFLSGVGRYGTDLVIDPTRGVYTFTKGAFTTTVVGTNAFNPRTALVLAAGGGTGTYVVRYYYTSAAGCTGEGFFRNLIINPLPVVNFSFAGGDNDFCASETSATLNITSIFTSSVFNGINGSFTINKQGSAIQISVINGIVGVIVTFDPSLLYTNALGGAGTYEIRYKYVDGNSCDATTPAQTFKIYSLPQPTFNFPVVGTTYPVCATATGLTLSPNILNGSDPTVGVFDGTQGFFTFTKGAFTYSLVAGDNNINPSTELVAAVGGGIGNYAVTYTYKSEIANGYNDCQVVTTLVRTLIINPLPALTFSINLGASICIGTTSFVLVPSVNGITPPLPLNGFFVINQVTPTAFFTFTPSVNVNTINLGSLNGLGTYNVFYNYTDNNGCANISAPTLISINPLPVIAIAFPASVPTFAGNANFCKNAPTVNFMTPVLGSGVFNANNGSYTITKGGYTQVINPISSTNPISSINPFALFNTPGAGSGTYSVIYTYTDGNNCTNTSNLLGFNINDLPVPAFDFALVTSGTSNFAICYNPLGTVALLPSLNNPSTDFGISLFTPAQGYFTITKIPTIANPTIYSVPLPNGISSISLAALFAAAGTGDYDIRYTYATNPQGCTVSTPETPLVLPLPASNNRRILTINPIPTVDFTFVPTGDIKEINANGTVIKVCANFTEVNLLPTSSLPPLSTSTSNRFVIQDITANVTPLSLGDITGPSFKITPAALGVPPSGTIVRTFRLTFNYTDANGCLAVSPPRDVVVVPLPIPTFTPVFACEGVPVTLTATGALLSDLGTSYDWNFGGGNIVTTTVPTIVHTFLSSGSRLVSVTINTALGCGGTGTQSINIGAIPVANFTTASFCQGNATNFNSTSTIFGTTSIDNYAWDFGDMTSSLTNATGNITHIYANPGKYTVRLTLTTSLLCTSFITKEVFIFPKITPTAAVPYKENFDSATDNNAWLPNGLIKNPTNLTQDITGYSWKRGVPTGVKINAATTNGGAWSTTGGLANSVGGLDSTFYPNERSFVESPCFNFTDITLTKPIISMKIWYDTDRGADGAVLYSSIDDGVTWIAVGTINEGLEWYNTAGIIAQPGGQPVVNAWTGNTLTEYKIAKFNLDKFRGEPSVRFRVAFGSNSDNTLGMFFDGFAFDDVFIGNRNRISLLEHFTNASSSEANTENTFINNFPSVATQNEVYNIQYHTNVPGIDPMNADNTADPSARALFYGVSQVPRTAIDGVIENRKFSEWGTPVYNKRTLETSPFELSVDFSSTTQLLRFKANVRALEPFSRRVILQTVVVEQEILGTALVGGNFGGLTFKNVVKKMIPNAAGTLIAQTWLQNTQFQTGELVWSPSKVYNGNKLVLVVFVQDEITKEVYQAGFFNITTNPTGVDPATALDPQTQAQMLDNEFVVYPNPAQNSVFTGFRNETAEDFKVVIFDSYGKRVDDYALPKGNKGLLLNTEKYASGMYFVEITGKNNIKARRKLVVAR